MTASHAPSPPFFDPLDGARHIAGVDEAGRGCLAGPVYAAAVIFAPGVTLDGLDDSKKLTAARRERLFERIQDVALAWSIAWATHEEIDAFNILRASLLAMSRAVGALRPAAGHCLVDGNQLPRLSCPAQAVVGGDAIHPCIMAASVLAKVARDREMEQLCAQYPGYGFRQHKGYATAGHRAALRRLGPSAVHRMSFAPCAQGALPLQTGGCSA